MPRTKQFDEEEVLNKAMELFWEKGFHATSMQDLVSNLGINRASMYDTYGGKEELFEKAFAHYRKSAIDSLQQLFNAASSVRLSFKKLFDLAIKETVSDVSCKGCFVVNTMTELVPGNDKLRITLENHKKKIESLFVSFVQKGIDNGEISNSKNANEIGLMLFALYNGIQVISKVDPNREKLQKVVNAGLSVLE